MILEVHSNARYLSKGNACIYVGGHLFMLSYAPISPVGNGDILTVVQILKHVMSLTA